MRIYIFLSPSFMPTAGLKQAKFSFLLAPYDDEMDASLLPAMIEALGTSPSSLFSSSSSSSPRPKGYYSYSALIAQEIQRRANAKKRLEELDNEDAEIASERGKEALRRLLWGKEITDMFLAECVRDFG